MEILKKNNNPVPFIKLNFNLKNWIFSFLDFEEIVNNLFYIHSEFNRSLKKNKMITFFQQNFDYLLQQIFFSNQILNKIKREFLENFQASDEIYNQILTHFLLKKYKKEKQLYLKRSYMPAKIVSNYVSKQKFIQLLDLTKNNLSNNPLNLKYLTDILLKMTNSLQKLYLSENEIGKNPTDMKYLSQGLIVNNSIKDLELNSNEIGRNKLDLYYLAQALKRNNMIENLYIYNNYIGNNKEDMMFIKDVLKFNKSIKELDLSWNSIGDNHDDFTFLSNGLKENKTISIISLTSNTIDYFHKIGILKNENPNLIIVSLYQD